MYTLTRPLVIGFSRTRYNELRLRRRAAVGDRRRRRHAGLRLQRRGCCAQRYRDDRRARSAAIRTRFTTRSRPTRRSRVARLLRELGSARRRELDLGDRGRAQGRLQPADIVFTGVGKSPTPSSSAPCALGLKAINVESAGRARRASRRLPRGSAGRRARRDPRQPGHRREEPSPHFDRPERSTSSACRLDEARALLAERSAGRPR